MSDPCPICQRVLAYVNEARKDADPYCCGVILDDILAIVAPRELKDHIRAIGETLALRVLDGEMLSDRENAQLLAYDCGLDHPHTAHTMGGDIPCKCLLCEEARKGKA